MRKPRKGVLVLTPFFSPNIGGVETHFDDLVKALDNRGYNVHVVTYSPITTPGLEWRPRERRGANIFIRRYRWFGKNLFHKIEKYPLLDFLYLTPYLAILSVLFMLRHYKSIDVVHAQGFNAALAGVILKKLFGVRLIVSTHAVYEIDPDSNTAVWIREILKNADKVLCLSRASSLGLESFGLRKSKLDHFQYWIDLDIFRPMDKRSIREKLNLEHEFTVLFVGRLIVKKGLRVLTEVARVLPEIRFIFIGVGPEEKYLQAAAEAYENIYFLGKIDNRKLWKYYNCADLFCIPSLYEEGFGRVVMEAAACGVPVVGSNKGGIPEALDESVSVLIEPNFENLYREIKSLAEDRERYEFLRKNCRPYTLERFSESNVSTITKYY
jgi:glycosyltransferase involved in cell wall biosynthesis